MWRQEYAFIKKWKQRRRREFLLIPIQCCKQFPVLIFKHIAGTDVIWWKYGNTINMTKKKDGKGMKSKIFWCLIGLFASRMTRNRKAYPQVSEASKSEDSPSPKRRKKRNARKRPKPIVLCECLRDTNEGNDDVDKIKCMQTTLQPINYKLKLWAPNGFRSALWN